MYIYIYIYIYIYTYIYGCRCTFRNFPSSFGLVGAAAAQLWACLVCGKHKGNQAHMDLGNTGKSVVALRTQGRGQPRTAPWPPRNRDVANSGPPPQLDSATKHRQIEYLQTKTNPTKPFRARSGLQNTLPSHGCLCRRAGPRRSRFEQKMQTLARRLPGLPAQ